MGIDGMSEQRKIVETYHAVDYHDQIYHAKIVLYEDVFDWKANYNFSYSIFNIQFDEIGSINIDTTRGTLKNLFNNQNSLFNSAITVETQEIANKKLIKKLAYALWRQKRNDIYVECFCI